MNYIKLTEQTLKSTSSPEEKVQAIFDKLVPKLMYISLPQITSISLKLLSLKRKLKEGSESYILYRLLIAFFEYKLLNYGDSIHSLKEIQNNFSKEGKVPFQATLSTLLGINYRSLGNSQQSLESFQQAFESDDKESQRLESESYVKSLRLYHVSELYGEMGAYQEMLKKQLELLKFSFETENVDIENRSLNGIGRAYFGLKNYEEALNYLLDADKKSQVAGNIPFITRNLHDLGRVYAEMEDYNNSLKYFEKSYELRKKHRSLDASISSLISIGQVYIQQFKYKEALDKLLEALEAAETLGVKRKIATIYEELSNACEKNSQFELALFYYKKYHDAKIKLDNINQLKIENQKLREENTRLRRQSN